MDSPTKIRYRMVTEYVPLDARCLDREQWLSCHSVAFIDFHSDIAYVTVEFQFGVER